jgi:hypothetical protein
LDYSSHRQQQNKRIKTKKQYGIIRQIKLRYAAKAMNVQSTSRKIDNIIEAISLAPTSSGLQPFEVIVTNQEVRKNQTYFLESICSN